MGSRRTVAELLQLLEPFDSDDDRERAREALLELGTNYQADTEEAREAPRRGEVIAELREIADAARVLRERLAAANQYTTGTLEGELYTSLLSQYPHHEDLLPLHDAAAASTNSGPSGLYEPDRWRCGEGGWLERLTGLERLAFEAAQRIRADSGGRANVYTDRYGSPKWRVAQEALSLGWHLGPNVDGPLLNFAEALLAFASDGREEGHTIRDYLHEVARRAREREAARKRIEELSECLLNLQRLCSREQLEPIEREFAELLTRSSGPEPPLNLRTRRARSNNPSES